MFSSNRMAPEILTSNCPAWWSTLISKESMTWSLATCLWENQPSPDNLQGKPACRYFSRRKAPPQNLSLVLWVPRTLPHNCPHVLQLAQCRGRGWFQQRSSHQWQIWTHHWFLSPWEIDQPVADCCCSLEDPLKLETITNINFKSSNRLGGWSTSTFPLWSSPRPVVHVKTIPYLRKISLSTHFIPDIFSFHFSLNIILAISILTTGNIEQEKKLGQ